MEDPALIDLTQSALDPRETARYSIPEAAHLLRMSRETLSSWVSGRKYPVQEGSRRFNVLIRRPVRDPRLSFSNLIEAHVLRALRREHLVPMRSIRLAIEHAQRHCEIERLLLSDELRTHAGEVFLDRLGQLINLSSGGQRAIREVLLAFLQRIDRDPFGRPERLFPFTRSTEVRAPRTVVIDARLAFGRPVIASKGIRTATCNERFDAGESASAIAKDYGLQVEEVEEAIRYEGRRLAA